MVFLSFISIVGFILYFSRYLSLRNVAPIFVISSIILTLFLFASAHILAMGAKILEICGFGLFLFSAYKIGAALLTKTNTLYRPSIGSVLFIVLGIIWFFFSRHMFIVGWDEFIWATFAKGIKHSDAFYGRNDIADGFVRYTPGIALFQYFFLTFKDFSDNALFFANGLIMLSAVAVMVDLTAGKILNVLLALASCVFLFGAFYGYNYLSITVDILLSFVFGAGLSLAVFQKGEGKYRLLAIFPIVAILPLAKETGAIFGLVVGSIFLLRILCEYEWNKTNLAHNLGSFILYALGIFLALLIPRYLWSHYLNAIHLDLPYSAIDFSTVKQVFLPTSEKNQFIASKFYDSLSTAILNMRVHTSFFHVFTTGFWLAFFTIIFLISMAFIQEGKKKKITCIALFLASILGFMVYAFFLLFAYQNFFTDYEGRLLASFVRYISTYVVAIGFLSLTCLTLARLKNPVMVVLILALMSLEFFMYPLGLWRSIINFNSPHSTAMQQYSVFIEKNIAPDVELVKKYVPINSGVYMIYQNSNGAEKIVFSYLVWPRRVEFWNWSLGEKYSDGDVWTTNFTVKDFKKALKLEQSKYLVLMHVDKNFWDHYASMFSPSDVDRGYRIFTILFDANGNLTLKPILSTGK